MEISELIEKGDSFFKQNDFTTAIEFFQAALQKECDNEKANVGISRAYKSKGDNYNAQKHVFKALSVDPNNQEAFSLMLELINNNSTNGEKSSETIDENEEKDFRIANWGDSKEIVMRKEGVPNIVDNIPNIYVFSDNIAGLPCTVLYSFSDNKLTMAKYIFDVKHSNDNAYIQDYEELVDLMTQKYGKPTSGGKHNAVWLNDLFKDDYSRWGLAISCGELVFESAWDTDNTEILLQLRGENYSISLVIQYVSKHLSALRETMSNKKKMSGL
jgi:tetratricopeptide (TPR) repeat protein